jgi:hypothetical protein
VGSFFRSTFIAGFLYCNAPVVNIQASAGIGTAFCVTFLLLSSRISADMLGYCPAWNDLGINFASGATSAACIAEIEYLCRFCGFLACGEHRGLLCDWEH